MPFGQKMQSERHFSCKKRALSLLPEKGHFGKLGGGPAPPPGSYTPAKNKTRLFSDNDIIDEIKNAINLHNFICYIQGRGTGGGGGQLGHVPQ